MFFFFFLKKNKETVEVSVKESNLAIRAITLFCFQGQLSYQMALLKVLCHKNDDCRFIMSFDLHANNLNVSDPAQLVCCQKQISKLPCVQNRSTHFGAQNVKYIGG